MESQAIVCLLHVNLSELGRLCHYNPTYYDIIPVNCGNTAIKADKYVSISR